MNVSSPGPLAPLSDAAGALAFGDLPVLGRALGAFVGDVLRVRRVHVEDAMTHAGIPEPARTAGEMYRSLGASFLELLWLGGARHPELEERVVIDPPTRRAFADLLAPGRGFVLAASHTGNWDLAAVATAHVLGPIAVVTKRLSLRAADRLWQWTRQRLGVSLVEGGVGALGGARAALAEGRAVAMMIDQVPPSPAHALRCPFLGREAWVDRAPAMVALRAGVPLVVTTAERLADGRQKLSIATIDAPPARGKSAWVDDATERATLALDGFVRRRPTEWLWMHRRWKEPASLAPTKTRALSPPT